VAHGIWIGTLVSAVLGTKLPGPGTIYLEQDLKFLKLWHHNPSKELVPELFVQDHHFQLLRCIR